MRIFLSYASEQKHLAEPIAFSLRSSGHSVFLDKDDLPAGRSYDDQIYKAIRDSDILIFLISPTAVSKGRYTLSELEIARRAWLHPTDRVIPVLVEPTDLSLVPSFLKGVTILEPQGNLAAEVRAAVESLGEVRGPRGSALKTGLQAGGLSALVWISLVMAAAVILYAIGGANYQAGYVDKILVLTLAFGIPISVVLLVWGSRRSWRAILPVLTLFPVMFIGNSADVNPMYTAFSVPQIDSASLGLAGSNGANQTDGANAPELSEQQRQALEQIEAANRLGKRYTAVMGGSIMGAALIISLLIGASMAATELRSPSSWITTVLIATAAMGLFSFAVYERAGQEDGGGGNTLIMFMVVAFLVWMGIAGGLVGYWLARNRGRYRTS